MGEGMGEGLASREEPRGGTTRLAADSSGRPASITISDAVVAHGTCPPSQGRGHAHGCMLHTGLEMGAPRTRPHGEGTVSYTSCLSRFDFGELQVHSGGPGGVSTWDSQSTGTRGAQGHR